MGTREIIFKKEIIQEVWTSSLYNMNHLSLNQLDSNGECVTQSEINKLDGGDWERMQETLGKLPTHLDVSSEENLTQQIENLKLSEEEIENLKLSLWKYHEEYNLNVSNLSDDSIDEAEHGKDVIPYLIENILDRGIEVLSPDIDLIMELQNYITLGVKMKRWVSDQK